MRNIKAKEILKCYVEVGKILFRADKIYTILLILIALVLGTLPGISTIVLQKLLNSLQQANAIHTKAFELAIIYLIIDLVIGVLNSIHGYLSPILKAKVFSFVSSSVLEKASKLSLKDFENSDVYDKIQRAQSQTGSEFFEFFVGFLSIFQLLIQMAIQMLILITWRKWTIVLIISVSIFSSLTSIKMNRKRYDILLDRTESDRKKWYYQYLLTKEIAFKEIKIYQLSSFFLTKFKNILGQYIKEDKVFYKKFPFIKLINLLLEQIATGTIFLLVIYDTILGTILVGDAITYIRCIGQIMSNVSGILAQFEFGYKEALYLGLYFDLLKIETVEDNGLEIDNITSIELKNVSYKYSEKEKYALRHINLILDGNLVLVGRNGSGKSTLVKLLAGLYDDYEGEILINGIELRKIKKTSLQRQISVLFQDYNKYEMTVRDNVAIGNLNETNDNVVLRTLKLVESPFSTNKDLNRQLGVWFRGGQQISGGEWLKLGLSRAFVRNSCFYILDEPNASLDPISELKILKNMNKIIKDKVAIIITHHIKNISRYGKEIVVLKEGEIVGRGFHEKLLKENSEYQELYHSEITEL